MLRTYHFKSNILYLHQAFCDGWTRAFVMVGPVSVPWHNDRVSELQSKCVSSGALASELQELNEDLLRLKAMHNAKVAELQSRLLTMEDMAASQQRRWWS